jgi:hypothetical protein
MVGRWGIFIMAGEITVVPYLKGITLEIGAIR